ncbi:hypothetical protein SDC9_121205 [bioreactor metagenome]|uniref:Uncharacterized protein n=1 Tax=bioreactor metagenome TaxID=1076179 RepID=A0A645CBB9_9ZZZZ
MLQIVGLRQMVWHEQRRLRRIVERALQPHHRGLLQTQRFGEPIQRIIGAQRRRGEHKGARRLAFRWRHGLPVRALRLRGLVYIVMVIVIPSAFLSRHSRCRPRRGPQRLQLGPGAKRRLRKMHLITHAAHPAHARCVILRRQRHQRLQQRHRSLVQTQPFGRLRGHGVKLRQQRTEARRHQAPGVRPGGDRHPVGRIILPRHAAAFRKTAPACRHSARRIQQIKRQRHPVALARRIVLARLLHVVRQCNQLPRAKRQAECLLAHRVQRMGLVKNHHIGMRRQIRFTALPGACQIGKEQVVIDNRHVRPHGLTTRAKHVAVVVARTLPAQTVVSRGGDLRLPVRVGLQRAQFRQIAAACGLRPGAHLQQPVHLLVLCVAPRIAT